MSRKPMPVSDKAAGKRKATQPEVPDEGEAPPPSQQEPPRLHVMEHNAPPHAGFPGHAMDYLFPPSSAPASYGFGHSPSLYPLHPSLHPHHAAHPPMPNPYYPPYYPAPPVTHAAPANEGEHDADEEQNSPEIKEESDDNLVFPEIKTILAETAPAAGKKRARKSAGKGKATAANPPTVPAQTHAAVPAAGSRRKPAAPAPKRGGRQPGATGYGDADLTEMLRLVREVLPLGPDEWVTIVSRFNKWARTNNRGERQVKAFRSKWDAIVRTPKPTGRAEVPWFVEESWEINDLIEQRAHVRPLNDARIDGVERSEMDERDIIEIEDTDDEEEAKRYVVRKKARVDTSTSAVPAVAGARQTRAGISSNLVTSIASAFNPAAQTARDEARAARQHENTYLQAMLFELRDARTRNETLSERLAEQTRRGDRLEDELRRRDESQAIAARHAVRAPDLHRTLISPSHIVPSASGWYPSHQGHQYRSPSPDRAAIAALAALAREEAGQAHVPLHSRADRAQGPAAATSGTGLHMHEATDVASSELALETSYDVTVTPRKRRAQREGEDA
ncbi:uncharacterized protein B0H18DRAFT_957474 [Fomitopsis serialis]|uniref:uncharacterized protein n=1 Tax=Fomitopsis serialis TaxID=139415 RepID=UPI00200800AA|nr:uncharacterized protein B0H18DRAFT_957471 [Neoantrodia serialis]XP_047889580.1 uncharacterized protein B0H18DRAFT_957474 [Neoantrodia serialis]KAH9919513.1 hypothetical protein B0H18DRAFT_957471 [Neoantrodia serialis]KAH9919516.1 hypothetical protein B0H18DRAFT_957474 [Neoantrodia serialis]